MGTLLGSLAWALVLGSLFLGTCSWEHCLVTCSWELSLGNLFLETLPACFKPVHWDLSWEPVFRNFAWEPCLGTCPSEPCLGFCSCFQPCLQMLFKILLCKLFLESCSWNMSNLKPCLGTCSWEPCWQPIARNLNGEFVLGTRTEPVLRTLAWEPVLAKLAW